MLITKTIKLLSMLAAGATTCMLFSGISANAADSDYRRNDDYIHYDQYENPYCVVDNVIQTGKFSLQPNYILGDVRNDGRIDALDAVSILAASSKSGSSTVSAEEFLTDYSDAIETEEQALLFADVDGNGKIDAVDAAYILDYAASNGSGETAPLGFAYYYADQEGTLQTGFILDNQTGNIYYADAETYQLCTKVLELDGSQYYFDEEGVLLSDRDTIPYEIKEMSGASSVSDGWGTDPSGERYYIDPDGSRHIGWLEDGGNLYRFDENGVLIVNCQESNGRYDENGVFTKSNYDIPVEIRNLLDNAERTPGIRHIDVKNRQHNILYETDPDLKKGINLSDRDYEIIEEFAAEHFSPDMTLSECLYETWWWIHCNVDYAYAGEKWNSIVNKTYVDAIFNYKMGQCVQYNGAMAAVLAYYGYDVYMVKGWTRPDFNNYQNSSSQHYWTEVMINGTRYYVETGNQGKNGDFWQYFFEDAENVDYTKSI